MPKLEQFHGSFLAQYSAQTYDNVNYSTGLWNYRLQKEKDLSIEALFLIREEMRNYPK